MHKVHVAPITGIWKLVSIESEAEDGETTHPYGRDVAGLVVIDPKGFFSVHTMNMKRRYFKVADPRGGTPEETREAFEGYTGYYGTYDINEAKRVIIFHVSGAWLPNWIGTDQIRYYTVKGNRLTVKTALMLFNGKQIVGKVTWKR
jgi:hypothetical protein